jgi:BirA family biotin operon repressor/biotin-[acetyl-CoA-carboxylase] ligase
MASAPPAPDLEPFLRRAVLPPGWRALYEPVVESTMDLARLAADQGWPDRSVFVADYQTAGRGRSGRRWLAAPGRGLLFTILLRKLEPVGLAGLLGSTALCEAIERLLALEPLVKWTNDIMIGRSKLAGLLVEAFSGPAGATVLIGCGVNVNQEQLELASAGQPATSLKVELGRPVHRGELLVLALEQLDCWLAQPPAPRSLALRSEWQARLWAVGREVTLSQADQRLVATIVGVAPDGALLIRERDGVVRRLLDGEILLGEASEASFGTTDSSRV